MLVHTAYYLWPISIFPALHVAIEHLLPHQKPMLFCWWLAVTVLAAFYGGILFSTLSSLQAIHINTPNDIAKDSRRLYVPYKSSMYSAIFVRILRNSKSKIQ